ncbi:hypothetical protein [Salinisphaera sp.]|uniref:hypothetical protein n=1 Tax=Salinisphaera sp. TaxID=1914330 RepID=UPI000C393071|nr:hypothetical protein [Salinisphaera sp.]MAS09908.1 hypothetical protein [Salinisphaera sp.]MAS09963.1 hypothetical protein [Salinisphaera sp.]|tara:strand:+ start:23875 stop:24138 length:264 start_codon:yes stop_codon:yes gene_type:complete
MNLRSAIREFEFPLYHVARFQIYRDGLKVDSGRFLAPGFLAEDAERHTERVIDQKMLTHGAHVAVYKVKKPNLFERFAALVAGHKHS